MTIEMLVKNSEDPENDYLVPITSMRAFKERWEPAIEKLKLEWVSAFGCSLKIHAHEEGGKQVLRELDLIIPEFKKEGHEYEAALAEKLKVEVERVLAHSTLTGYI